ncbi:MlaD family protein [Patulibacter sp. NPDC049589]|uniref:MlaD family protein n=1 Tax=Patulibacter sp. NPDC049589 TaxID=3154731 RepID=UPI00341C1660
MKNQHIAGKSFVLFLILIGGLAILAYFYSTAGGRLPLSEKPYKVTAILTDSQQVLKHADVRSAGVKIGEVGDIENSGDGRRVRLTLELKKKYAPVYRDAKVLVRQKTLVGENYVDLTVGDRSAGQVANGGTLTVAAQKEAVPIDQVLNTLDPKTRKSVSEDLRAGGDTLKGRGSDLNELFGRVRPVAEDGSALLSVLNRQRGQITRLVRNTGTVMAAIGSRSGDLQNLVRTAKTTAQAIADRDASVERTFASLPPTLRQARTSVAKLESFAGTSTPTVNDLRTSLQSLKPVLTELRPTAARARRLTDALPALFKATNPALATLPTFADAGSDAIPKLEGTLRQINPALAHISPYGNDLVGFVENFGSSRTYDQNGVMGICRCPVGVNSIANFPGTLRSILAPLLDEGPVGDLLAESDNQYRLPNKLPDASVPFSKGNNWKVIKPDTTPNEVVK